MNTFFRAFSLVATIVLIVIGANADHAEGHGALPNCPSVQWASQSSWVCQDSQGVAHLNCHCHCPPSSPPSENLPPGPGGLKSTCDNQERPKRPERQKKKRHALDSPVDGAVVSGHGVIYGWFCKADRVDVWIRPVGTKGWPHKFEVPYGAARADTESACGDTDNGFGLAINWNMLGDGEHEVLLGSNNRDRERVFVVVTTLGEEFASDLSGTCKVRNFPDPGDRTTLEWQESIQNFAIIAVD